VCISAIAEHSEIVSYPARNEVGNTESSQPGCVASHEVEVERIHVLYHPLCALSIAVIPSAVSTSFFGPNVYHFSCEI
jgi:hypothetical protein